MRMRFSVLEAWRNRVSPEHVRPVDNHYGGRHNREYFSIAHERALTKAFYLNSTVPELFFLFGSTDFDD